jgi:hypothetical protein
LNKSFISPWIAVEKASPTVVLAEVNSLVPRLSRFDLHLGESNNDIDLDLVLRRDSTIIDTPLVTGFKDPRILKPVFTSLTNGSVFLNKKSLISTSGVVPAGGVVDTPFSSVQTSTT